MSKVGAIILAAGSGRRMGGGKLMLPVAGKPMVLHVADAIASAGLGAPIVALGHQAAEIAALFIDRPHIPLIVADCALGMAHSLRAAIAAVPPEWEAAFICLSDMPYISEVLLTAMTPQAAANVILVPRVNGQRGNPVVWGRTFFPALVALSGDSGGRQLLGQFPDAVRHFETDDTAILRDIDEPADLLSVSPARP
jgi:molybdenum cofactor cytidylyltransferase